MMTESQLTRRLCRELEELGALTFAVVGGMRQEAGWPDRYVAHAVWSGWLEFKVYGNALSPLQAKRLRELESRGVAAMCVNHDEFVVSRHDGTVVGKFGNAAGLLCLLQHSCANWTDQQIIARGALVAKGAKYEMV